MSFSSPAHHDLCRPCSPLHPGQSRSWDEGRKNMLHTDLLSKSNAPTSACRQDPWQLVGLSPRAKAQGFFSPRGRPKWLANWVGASVCREFAAFVGFSKGSVRPVPDRDPRPQQSFLAPSLPLEGAHGDFPPRGLKSAAWLHGIVRSAGAGLSQLPPSDVLNPTPRAFTAKFLLAPGPAGSVFLITSESLNSRHLKRTLTPKAVFPARTTSSRTWRSDILANISAA